MRKLKHHFYQRHGSSNDAENNGSASSSGNIAGGASNTAPAAEYQAGGKKAVGAKIGSLENIHWKSQGGTAGLNFRDRPLPTEGGNKDKNNNHLFSNNTNNNNNNATKRPTKHAASVLPLIRGPRWRPNPEGETALIQEKLEFQKRARAKIGSLENINYKSASVSVYPFTSPPKGS